MTDRICAVDGCNLKIKARGLCQTHYLQTRPACDIADCIRPRFNRGLCRPHSVRLKKTGIRGGPIEDRAKPTLDLVEDLDWLLGGGESPWQAARQVGVAPDLIMTRLHKRRADIEARFPGMTDRLLGAFRVTA